MTTTTINIMTHNLEAPDNMEQRRSSGREAINYAIGGIGVLNEIHGSDIKYYTQYLKSKGLLWYRFGSNAIVWDPRVVRKHKANARMIMRGGYVGADGVATAKKGDDDRRVGPNRYNLKWCGEVIADSTPLMANGTHKMAKGYTTHKWRLPLLIRSHANLAKHVREDLRNYPNGFIAGDENSIPYVEYPGLADVKVPTPPTHGPRRYDQIHTFGDVTVTQVREFYTPSDHDGLQGKLLIGGGVTKPKPPTLPKVKTRLPKPGTKVNWKKYGAPVRHPWANKSPRWKRRHPRLWNSIVRWRAAYNRRRNG